MLGQATIISQMGEETPDRGLLLTKGKHQDTFQDAFWYGDPIAYMPSSAEE